MKYKPMARDAEVNEASSILQAVYALDAAGVVAETTNDVEGLLNVAAMWMKLGEAAGQFMPMIDSDKEKFISLPTGFQRSDITIEEDENE
jgi:hypothetical protein